MQSIDEVTEKLLKPVGHCWTATGNLFMVAPLSFRLVPIIFWATLCFGTHRWSMFILVLFLPQHLSFLQGAWFLLVENGIEKPTSDYKMCLLLLVGHCFSPSKQSVRKSMYLCIFPRVRNQVPIIINIFIHLFTHKKTEEVVL